MNNVKNILAIETSCDETAAAVVSCDLKSMQVTPLSSVVYSQIDLHKKYGGVYPELASREHIRKIMPVVDKALFFAQSPNPKYQIPNKSQIRNNKNQTRLTSNFYTSKHPIDAIAVTVGPGLAGSLIVGVEFARGLAASLGVPVVPVNHLEGHIYANFVDVSPELSLRAPEWAKQSHQIATTAITPPRNDILFPALALVVSGGHTQLVLMRDHLQYEIIGTTVDDAAGECFDKIARMLGLPYPGGPALSKLAEKGDPKAYDFPRAMMNNPRPSAPTLSTAEGPAIRHHPRYYDFSFSGLKTSVFYKLRSLGLVDDHAEPTLTPRRWPNACPSDRRGLLRGVERLEMIRTNVAASAQQAIVDVLVAKTFRAAQDNNVKSILVGGGVSANSALRAEFARLKAESRRLKVFLSPLELTGDNALSIAIAGAYHYKNGDTVSWHDLDTDPSLRLQ